MGLPYLSEVRRSVSRVEQKDLPQAFVKAYVIVLG